MPGKKIVQDIRTIRNIPTRTLDIRRPIEPPPPPPRAPSRMKITPPPPPPHPPRRTRRSRLWGMVITFLIVFICIAVIAVALSLLYSKASVTITPKVASFDIKGTFTAKKDTSSAGAGASATNLVYDVVTKTDVINQTIAATDGPLLQAKAKGTATLYNEQDSNQIIVAGSRLSNSEGKVYRTASTVIIPALKSTPGTISVEIVADEAGSEYNMTLSGDTNLKFVGFKGTDRYSVVYGKIKTAISGGFSGNKKSIDPETEKATILQEETDLKNNLIKQIKQNVPENNIFYESAYSIDYEVADPISKDENTAVISIKGTIYAVIFKKDLLLKSIAGKELDKFPSPTYNIKGIDELAFSVVNSKDFSAKKVTPLIFSLKGPVQLVGTFNEVELKNELKGTYLKQSNAIFSHYPSIANAYALITPFWMRSFPNSAENIRIEVKD